MSFELQADIEAHPEILEMDDYDIITEYLGDMGLPVPEDGEYMVGHESFFMFLSRFGLVFKMMNENEVNNIALTRGSDLALQPLKMAPLTKGAFAILPAIKNTRYDTATRKIHEADKIFKDILVGQSTSCPFELHDLEANNIGLLPAKMPVNGTEKPVPVILDHGSIRKREDSAVDLQAAFSSAAYSGIQDRIFGRLKEELQSAWPEGRSPDTAKMRDFFRRCASIVDLPKDDPSRILNPSWKTLEGSAWKLEEAQSSAYYYEDALKAANFSLSPALAPAQ